MIIIYKISIFFSALLAFNLCWATPPIQNLQKKTILLTAFEPFGGSHLNGSQIVAELIKKQNQLEEKQVTLSVCILPVEYDRAHLVARKCYQDLPQKPDVIISLGEGGCSIRLESRFHNSENTPSFPDNAGVVRMGEVIEKGAPDHIPTGLNLSHLYCSSNDTNKTNTEIEILSSQSPGHFVCNSTAYRLKRFFENEKKPYGFVHVPNTKCSNFDADKIASSITKLLLAATRSASQAHLEKATQCEQDFVLQLSREYQKAGLKYK